MQKQSKFLESQNLSLKKVYPQLEKRQHFVTKKLKDCTLKNPFVVRVQPLTKYFHETEKIKYITFIVQGDTLMAQINANVNRKLGLSSSTSLFLVSCNSLVENKQTIKDVAEKAKDQDGIVYVFYAQQDPFGGQELEKGDEQQVMLQGSHGLQNKRQN